MGIFDWLFGGKGRKRFSARRVERALGPWKPYTGEDTIPRTGLPRTLTLPDCVKKCGATPGEYPLSDVLLPFWLRLDPALCGYAVQRIKRGGLYKRVEIPRTGKAPRQLDVPHPFLRWVQRRILSRLLEQMDVHPAAHGFVKKRSVFTGAEPHVGKRVVVHLDLRDFFPTITFARVVGLFRSYGFDRSKAAFLAGLCCFQGRLPQGAPSSPAISNLVCRRLDSRLAGLAQKCGADYTRYADDLTLSGPEALLRVLPLARRIVHEEGFQLAPEKTRVMRSGSRQRVTGLNVNSKVSVPRRVRRVLRAMVHAQGLNGEAAPGMVPFLRGHAAFMRPAHPAEAERLECELRKCR